MLAYEQNTAELRALLLKADLKVTLTRLTILHILRSAQRELTVTEILYSPQQQLKKLSCAGIYQALRQLERAGLVAKFKLGDEQALYSFKNTQANIRICCRQCGRLEQIADPLFELQIQELILIHGASSYHLTLEKPKCFCCAENAAEQPDHPRR